METGERIEKLIKTGKREGSRKFQMENIQKGSKKEEFFNIRHGAFELSLALSQL